MLTSNIYSLRNAPLFLESQEESLRETWCHELRGARLCGYIVIPTLIGNEIERFLVALPFGVRLLFFRA